MRQFSTSWEPVLFNSYVVFSGNTSLLPTNSPLTYTSLCCLLTKHHLKVGSNPPCCSISVSCVRSLPCSPLRCHGAPKLLYGPKTLDSFISSLFNCSFVTCFLIGVSSICLPAYSVFV